MTDCTDKFKEKCSIPKDCLEYTSCIVYDGSDLTCINDEEFIADSGTKLNLMIALIWTKLCNAIGSIVDIQNQIDVINTTITTIQGDITTIQGDIITIQGDITTLQNDVTNIQNELAIPPTYSSGQKDLNVTGRNYGSASASGTILPFPCNFLKIDNAYSITGTFNSSKTGVVLNGDFIEFIISFPELVNVFTAENQVTGLGLLITNTEQIPMIVRAIVGQTNIKVTVIVQGNFDDTHSIFFSFIAQIV